MRKSSINTKTKIVGQSEQSSGLSKIKTCLRQYFVTIPDREKLVISRKEYKIIDDFKPEAIYTLGASINALRLSYMLSIKYNIPIIIHHMDNWMHSIQWESNPLLQSYISDLRKMCLRCYERSNVCLAISDKMAKDFTNEFGVEHLALMNSIDVNRYCCKNEQHNILKFVYAGGLHLDRYGALLDLAQIIEECQSDNTKKAELEIYTSLENIKAYGSLFDKFKSTKIIKAVPHTEISRVYSTADVLVHVESTLRNNNTFFQYSISTKIPEYLSTGKPMLFYGPNNIYLYDLLKKEDIALVADTKETLKKCINSILNIEIDLRRIGNSGREYAKKHFDLEKSAKILDDVFNRAKAP
jgi:glycosyltransferase involved in cell wall biosynthesis